MSTPVFDVTGPRSANLVEAEYYGGRGVNLRALFLLAKSDDFEINPPCASRSASRAAPAHSAARLAQCSVSSQFLEATLFVSL
jgi:hypothetical protein